MLRKYFEFVRFSHTIFALPFALAAMVCARTAAMGFNRIADRKLDAMNPRTAQRHLPAGKISVTTAWCLVIGAAAGFVAVTWLINPICFYLSPVALAVIFFYSFTKRFTSLSHFFLGLSLALAPVGAWLAVRGEFAGPPVVLAVAVVLWLVGFDIIYATQDYDFDKAHGLRSLPVRLGIAGSLRFACVAHAVMVAALLGFGLISGMRVPYYVGLGIIFTCLVIEHRLARNRDPVSLNVAFFRMNAAISVVLLAAVVVDVVWR
jgi:4-hydroxybenzoate polyprenyltransferase